MRLSVVAPGNVARVNAAWASHYLPTMSEDIPAISHGDGVSAIETGQGMFQLAMQSGEHRFLADEPPSVGGLGTGLSPYEPVSAGLAACRVMTMRLYAQRKDMPLERAAITVTPHKRVGETLADLFERVITLEGPLDDEQHAKLVAIADPCPVDLTLVRGSDVTTGWRSDARQPGPSFRPWPCPAPEPDRR
jgi:uncharacterized OsmC-like protein